MRRKFVIPYIAMALVSWYLCAGMMFSAAQSISPRYRRQDMGMSIAAGAIYGAVWPLGLPMAWLVTGFAEHGIWNDQIVRPAEAQP